jgi:hypothetical protein
VETTWDDIQRGGLGRLKWPSRSERGGDTGGLPGVVLPVILLAGFKMRYNKHGDEVLTHWPR